MSETSFFTQTKKMSKKSCLIQVFSSGTPKMSTTNHICLEYSLKCLKLINHIIKTIKQFKKTRKSEKNENNLKRKKKKQKEKRNNSEHRKKDCLEVHVFDMFVENSGHLSNELRKKLRFLS